MLMCLGAYRRIVDSARNTASSNYSTFPTHDTAKLPPLLGRRKPSFAYPSPDMHTQKYSYSVTSQPPPISIPAFKKSPPKTNYTKAFRQESIAPLPITVNATNTAKSVTTHQSTKPIPKLATPSIRNLQPAKARTTLPSKSAPKPLGSPLQVRNKAPPLKALKEDNLPSWVSDEGDVEYEVISTHNSQTPKLLPANKAKKTKRTGATFVSSHFRVDEAAITEYFSRKKFVCKKQDKHIILKECPFCPDTKSKLDNMWKLYVMRDSGAYFCHRCGSKGSWFDLKANLGDIPQITNSSGEQEEPHAIPNQQIVASYPNNLQNYPDVIQWLTGTRPTDRHLLLPVVQKYEVGACVAKFLDDNNNWVDNVCVTFPWINFDAKGNRQISRVKMRSVDHKKNMRLEPKGGRFGFFGWHTIPQDAVEVVLTEGEFDAMAVHQATGQPAISLPNGANSLPVTLIPLLEKFERIYLWLDDDVAGQEGAKKFAQKLGVHRCFIVHTKDGNPAGPKDANDALKMGKDLIHLLLNAKRPSHDQVVTFSEVRREVELELLHPEQAVGIQSLWFPSLNNIIKGHRKGEVTVVTGATGIGKTTLLSQLSLDYCLQGVRTLWGSFELQLPRLVKKMLYQYSNKNLAECVDQFDVIADRFSALPMYFLRFFGSTQVDQVLDAMEYTVYRHDVEHIIIDNIQFMTSCQGKGAERFEVIDDAIHKFRRFATHHNVHLTLVIHPRKQDDEVPLSMADVFGNAKATQEADNVIILQKNKQLKYPSQPRSDINRYMDIRKNRYSGDLGRIPVYFDKQVQRFTQQAPPTQPNKHKPVLPHTTKKDASAAEEYVQSVEEGDYVEEDSVLQLQ